MEDNTIDSQKGTDGNIHFGKFPEMLEVGAANNNGFGGIRAEVKTSAKVILDRSKETKISEITGGRITTVKPFFHESWMKWAEYRDARRLIRVYFMIREGFEETRCEERPELHDTVRKILEIKEKGFESDEQQLFEMIAKIVMDFLGPGKWRDRLNDTRICELVSAVDGDANAFRIISLLVHFQRDLTKNI